MTLWAERKPGGEYVILRACYGPVSFEIEESRGHALNFWHELGKHVIENVEDRAKAGYERFHGAVGGAWESWEDLVPAHREAWIAAFTE